MLIIEENFNGGDISNDESILHDDGKALERVRELELELAQTKLAHVEAECRNQVT